MFLNIFLSLLWFIVTCLATAATFGLFEDDEFVLGSVVGLLSLASWSLMISMIAEAVIY